MSQPRLADDGGGFWGVGRYGDSAGEWREISLTEVEFHREVDAAEARLRSWNVQANDIILLIGGIAEAAQLAPFQRAARRLEAITVTAEPSEFDARRVAAMMERFTLRAVIGLEANVLAGLAQVGDPKAILSRCENLIVRDDVYETTVAMGLSPARLSILGAASAVECPARAGAHVDPRAWTVGSPGTELEFAL